MIVAGVIAAFGVIEANEILIVGAMAVSPDLLPIAATCVGLVGRRYRLAWRALVTLPSGWAAAWPRRSCSRRPRRPRPLARQFRSRRVRALRPDDRQRRDDPGGAGRGHRGHACARDAGELGGWRGDLDHHDPGRGLSRSRPASARGTRRWVRWPSSESWLARGSTALKQQDSHDDVAGCHDSTHGPCQSPHSATRPSAAVGPHEPGS